MSVFPADLDVAAINRLWLPKLDRSIGLSVVAVEGDSLVAEIKVTDTLLQPFGVMHGGVSCVLSESMGSVAGGMTLKDPDLTVVGQSLYALHLRPVHLGMTLRVEASPEHIGRRTQIWNIALSDKETKKPTAKVTLTLAVIEKASTQRK